MNAWLKMCRGARMPASRNHQHLAATVTSESLKYLSDSPTVSCFLTSLHSASDRQPCVLPFSSFDSEHLYIFNIAHIAPLASRRWLTCLFNYRTHREASCPHWPPDPETIPCFKTKRQSVGKMMISKPFFSHLPNQRWRNDRVVLSQIVHCWFAHTLCGNIINIFYRYTTNCKMTLYPTVDRWRLIKMCCRS